MGLYSAAPCESRCPPCWSSHDFEMRLVVSTASALLAATAASTLSRVSSVSCGITLQLTMATVFALLIFDASERSNEQRWLNSGLIPTTRIRENDWSCETPSDHPPSEAWLGNAANDATPTSNKAGKKARRLARC